MDSTADEVAKLKATQQTAMAKQMKLDEESLQRLAAEKEAAKVAPGPDPLFLRTGAVWEVMIVLVHGLLLTLSYAQCLVGFSLGRCAVILGGCFLVQASASC